MMTERTPEELEQSATGKGYDPDQVWDDEPGLDIDLDTDIELDLSDPEDIGSKQAVVEETVR
jgi:hypothetical protein